MSVGISKPFQGVLSVTDYPKIGRPMFGVIEDSRDGGTAVSTTKVIAAAVVRTGASNASLVVETENSAYIVVFRPD